MRNYDLGIKIPIVENPVVYEPDYIPYSFNKTEEYKGFNSYVEERTDYVMFTKLDYSTAYDTVCRSLKRVGKLTLGEPENGFIKGKLYDKFHYSFNVQFVFNRLDDNEYLYITATVKNNFVSIKNKDWAWDYFLNAMYAYCPCANFFAQPCCGEPKVKRVLEVGSDVITRTVSDSVNNPSILGTLIGYGEGGFMAGEVLGNMWGTQHTETYVTQRTTNSVPVKIVYNNGRIYNGRVKKKTRLFREITASMNNIR